MRTATPAATETPTPPKRQRVNRNAPRAEDKLSFFRRATPAEIKAGSSPLIFWAVEPSGDYGLDCKRGHAIAEEMMGFLIEAPTVENLHMLGCMLIDMQRFATPEHQGLFVGFGLSMARFALVGAKVIGPDAIRKANEISIQAAGLDH